MAKLMSIKDMPIEARIKLLEELGYTVNKDKTFVFKNGIVCSDKYTDEKIRVDNMFIYPGSTILLDNNPLSITSFLEEFGDVF